MDNQEAREAVIKEALSWMNPPTKYHHMGRVKGAGVDCGMFLAEVYERAGVISHIEPAPYPHDWHLHRSEERYLNIVEQYAHKIETEPQPGDIVLFKFGRCISHGGIIIQWPEIIHSYLRVGVTCDNSINNSTLRERIAGFWSPWGKY